MNIIVSIAPVFLYLLLLYALDSFKLVRRNTLLSAFILGLFSALLAAGLYQGIQALVPIDGDQYSRYVAPVTEELLKGLMIVVLIRFKKAGFLIDAGIYGFAVGAGFAVAENIFYLNVINDPNLLLWMLRGLGTSIMHSGNCALLAFFAMGAVNRERNLILPLLISLMAVMIIHSVYNHFLIDLLWQVMAVALLYPLFIVVVFDRNKRQLQDWLEVEFFNEAGLLILIRQGEFGKSKAGLYLQSLKQHLHGEMLVDMYCFIQLYLELSIAFKRNILLKENELPVVPVADAEAKLKELFALRRAIGKSGELLLAPVIRLTDRDLWKLKGMNS